MTDCQKRSPISGSSISHLFNKFKRKNILVAGDFILDRYTFGTCRRISPEAPVPVVNVSHEEERAGGAGNVAVNLLSLGMNPIVFGRVGSDHAGVCIRNALQSEGIQTHFLYEEVGFQTPLKVRLIASSQQLTRIDYEKQQAILADTEMQVLAQIPKMLSNIDLVAISDYAKGFLTPKILSALISTAQKLQIPVISDPKGTEFAKYSGSTILKPNLSEAFAAVPAGLVLDEAAAHIMKSVSVDVLMITRSESGISLFYPDGASEEHPVDVQEVKDVTGAGDTVLAVLSSSIANGISVSQATQLANIGAQVAISRLGCARVTLSEIARAIVEHNTHKKIFDEAHFPALQQALHGDPCTIFTISANEGFTSKLFRQVHTQAALSKQKVIVALLGDGPDEELISALAALKDVAYVLMLGKNSESLLTQLCPKRLEMISS